MPLWWSIVGIFIVIYLLCGTILFILDYTKNKNNYRFEFLPWSYIEIVFNWIFVIDEYRRFGMILFNYQREWKSELSDEEIKNILEQKN